MITNKMSIQYLNKIGVVLNITYMALQTNQMKKIEQLSENAKLHVKRHTSNRGYVLSLWTLKGDA